MDSLFYWLSKLAWFFISPDNLLILLFVVGLILLIWKKQRLAKSIFIFIFIFIMSVGFLPVGEWVLYPLEKQYPAKSELKNVDGIIALAGGHHFVPKDYWKQPVSKRNIAFIDLAIKYPTAKMIFTGGSGNLLNQEGNGADIAKLIFSSAGLNISNIYFERKSRNTWENVTFSKKLSKHIEGENWVLITSAWHMPRSVGVFCKANWEVTPFPVGFTRKTDNFFRLRWDYYRHLNNLKVGIKEWIGIAVYKFTGKMCDNENYQNFLSITSKK